MSGFKDRILAFRDLEKMVISDRWMEDYRREHIARAFEVRLKGGLIKPRHPHRNHPYCNICDEDYEEWDVGYRLYVGGHPVVYHADCIEESYDTKKVKNILAQDRGFRRRMMEGKEEANELKVRTQLYKCIIGSVLGDGLGADRPSVREPLPDLTPFSHVIVEEDAAIPLGVIGVAETVTRDTELRRITE
jgi:hypothetical protein